MADNDGMVLVELRNSIGRRVAGGGRTQLYGPGRVRIPVDMARALNLDPIEEDDAEEGDAGGGQTDPYKDWTKGQFIREAEARKLTVTRADGKDGEPLVSDYRAALEADDRE